MRVKVFGAQSHIGFALCEKFLEEGIEVCAIFLDCSIKKKKLLLEQRLMLIGRNALFQEFSLEDERRNEAATHVFYCKDESHDQDQICFKKSVEEALETNSHFFYVTPANIKGEGEYQQLQSTLTSFSIFKLPKLYGPFQPPEEKIHQHLHSFLSDQRKSLIINEPLVYITDAAETIVEVIGKGEYEKVYSFLIELKEEEIKSLSVELKMNATQSAEDESSGITLLAKTSIEEGLLEQLSCIKTYRGIYELDS